MPLGGILHVSRAEPFDYAIAIFRSHQSAWFQQLHVSAVMSQSLSLQFAMCLYLCRLISIAKYGLCFLIIGSGKFEIFSELVAYLHSTLLHHTWLFD